MRVWDPLLRVVHWALVAGIASAWLTSETGRELHEPIGWGVLALVGVRLLWGRVGPRHARWRSFVRAPRSLAGYVGRLIEGRAERHLGHNPLGGWMVVLLLATITATGLTGWLMSTDAGFGSEAIEELHEALASALLGLVALHVAGVLFSGWLHGENLVRAMWTGAKRVPAGDDVP